VPRFTLSTGWPPSFGIGGRFPSDWVAAFGRNRWPPCLGFRIIILGMRDRLMPYITTRLRGSEIVPYIVHHSPIREPHNIAEIVVGPAAAADAERSVRTLLDSFGVDPSVESVDLISHIALRSAVCWPCRELGSLTALWKWQGRGQRPVFWCGFRALRLPLT
jgi:hypothetical protein